MKGKYSKVLVSLVIALNIGFTAAVLAVFRKTGDEPTALVAAWFSFTTGELWLLASIKKMKVKKGAEKKDDLSQPESNDPEAKNVTDRSGERDCDLKNH